MDRIQLFDTCVVMRVVFILLALGAVGAVAFQFPPCPRDKVHKPCGCATTCEDIENEIKCAGCKPGCFCPDGEVEFDGECSDPSVCANEVAPPEDNEEFPDSDDENPEDGDGTDSESDDENENDCTGGKIFQPCGSACPPTCGNTDQLCTLQCKKGCFCPAGTVEHEGECLDPDECPGVTTEPMECGVNEIYNECGSACTPQNCENRNEVFFCAAVCQEGCFCKENYFRNANKECVAIEDCEGNSENEEYLECGDNEVERDCETVCKEGFLSESCSNIEPMCRCTEEYVRLEGECVSIDVCEELLVNLNKEVLGPFKEAIPEEVGVPTPAPTSDPILVSPVPPKPYICKRGRHGRRHRHRHHHGRNGGEGNGENEHDRHDGDEDRDCPPEDRIYTRPNPHIRPMETPLPGRPYPGRPRPVLPHLRPSPLPGRPFPGGPRPDRPFPGPPRPDRPFPGHPRDKDRSENGRGDRRDGRP